MMKMIRDRKTKMRPHNTDAFLFLYNYHQQQNSRDTPFFSFFRSFLFCLF